jgi:hypothetical protein
MSTLGGEVLTIVKVASIGVEPLNISIGGRQVRLVAHFLVAFLVSVYRCRALRAVLLRSART